MDALAPVIQTRVASALFRAGSARNQRRDPRQDVEDFTQEVFVALFADDARALRSWDSSRGLSLLNFVGLVAEHQVASLLRSGRRNPWTDEPMISDELEREVGSENAGDGRIHSREFLLKLLEGLRAALPPRGLVLFQLLIIDERAPSDVCLQMGMSADALYAWKSRLNKLVRRLADDLEGAGDPPRSLRLHTDSNRGEERAP